MNKFVKLHSCGNSFLFFFKKINFLKLFKNTNKFSGIQTDQIILIDKIDFINKILKIKIYNKDKSIALNCGNGIRCLSWFLIKKNKDIIKIKTKNSIIYAWKIKNKIFNCFILKNKIKYLILKLKTLIIRVGFYNLDNLHLIVFVKNINSNYIIKIEKLLRKLFENKINIEFVQIISKSEVFIRIFEKGVGETLSCGSGMISSAKFLNFCFRFKNIIFNCIGGKCKIEIFHKKIVINSNVNFTCFGYI